MTPVCPDKRPVWRCGPLSRSVTRLERTPAVCCDAHRISQANRIWYWKMTTGNIFGKYTHTDRLQECFSDRCSLHAVSVCLLIASSVSPSLVCQICVVAFVFLYSVQLSLSVNVGVKLFCQDPRPWPHRHRITSLSQTTHNVSSIIYMPDGKCSWSGFVCSKCIVCNPSQLHLE